MNTFARTALGAALVLVLAGCASSSGQPWTPPPAATPGDETPAPASMAPGSMAPGSMAPMSMAPGSAAPSADASVDPSAPAASAPAGSPAPSADPSASASEVPGDARIIELEMDAALQILQDGVKVTDIPVTPGETVIFRVTNTAGYVHNFWIGTDQQLMTDQTDGLVGHDDWQDTEPRDIEWTVPEDIEGLKYGCTVPGHYSLMQGTFSLAS